VCYIQVRIRVCVRAIVRVCVCMCACVYEHLHEILPLPHATRFVITFIFHLFLSTPSPPPYSRQRLARRPLQHVAIKPAVSALLPSPHKHPPTPPHTHNPTARHHRRVSHKYLHFPSTQTWGILKGSILI